MTCFEAEKNLKFPRISPAPTEGEGIRSLPRFCAARLLMRGKLKLYSP
jgi:hypothetical protein